MSHVTLNQVMQHYSKSPEIHIVVIGLLLWFMS